MAKAQKCKNCGSNLVFSPALQMLVCEHCESTKSIDESDYEAQKIALDIDYISKDSGASDIKCPNCGAMNNITQDIISLECAYCGSDLVASNKQYDIDAIVPFSVSKEQANGLFTAWAKKKIMAPRAFKKMARLDRFSGHYVPSWSFDSKVDSVFKGTEIIRTMKKRNGRFETDVKRRYFSGSMTNDYKDIIIAGNDIIQNGKLEQLEPFSYNKLKVYSEEYLFGFLAENFTISVSSAFAMAKTEVETKIANEIKASKEGSVEDLKITSTYTNTKQARYLLPIWKSNFKYKQKNYDCLINGSTGKIVSKSPVSGWKVFGVIIALLFIAGIIGTIYMICNSGNVDGVIPSIESLEDFIDLL